jgi:hypothetical protein
MMEPDIYGLKYEVIALHAQIERLKEQLAEKTEEARYWRRWAEGPAASPYRRRYDD